MLHKVLALAINKILYVGGAVVTPLFNKVFCTDPTLPTDATIGRTGVTATVTDFEGRVIGPLPANEARFWGQRRVENLAIRSEDFTLATGIWSSGELGSGTGKVITFDNISGNSRIFTPVALPAGSTVTISIDFDVADAGKEFRLGVFDGAWDYGSRITIPADGSRVARTVTVTNALQFVGIVRGGVGFSQEITVATGIQIENVTGQTDTSPGEYVSVVVGTGSELVTNGTFDDNLDDWNNNDSILTNPSGEINVETIVSYGRAIYTLSNLVVGKTYVKEADFTYINVAGSFHISANADGSGAPVDGTSTHTSSSSKHFNNTFVAGATTRYLVLQSNDAIAGRQTQWDNVSVKEADHGAFVDGVKYFATANGNTVDGNGVVTEATGAALTNPIRGLLIEKASATNLVNYSQQIDNAYWSKTNLTVTAGWADLLDEGTNTGQHVFSRLNITVASGVAHTITQRVKANSFAGRYISLYPQSGTDARANYDIATDTVSASAGTNLIKAYVVDVGNDWKDLVLTFTTTSTNLHVVSYINVTSTIYSESYLGTSKSYWTQGIQLEAGNHSTSHIPTTTGTVQRDNENVHFHSEQPTDGFAVLSMAWPTGYDTAPTPAGSNGILSWDEEGTAFDYRNLYYQVEAVIGKVESNDEGGTATAAQAPMAAYTPVEYAVWISGTNSEYGMGLYGNDTSAPDECQWEGGDWAAGVAHNQAYPTDPADTTLLGAGYSQEYPMIFMGLLIAEREDTDSTYLENNYTAFGCGCE